MSRSGKGLNKKGRLAILPAAIAATLSGMALSAHAFQIESDNPDVEMRWSNTVRYNYAMRMQGVDEHVALAAPGASAGAGAPTSIPGAPRYSGYASADALFAKHDTISNRLDWLTEFNFLYLNKYGFRVSAAAWYDNAYAGKRPAIANTTHANQTGTAYIGNEFTDYVKRYYAGPSGEWLDAYVFGNFDIGESALNVRLGRHAVVWGEGLIGSNHSIAYSQAPSDSRKAVGSPGASAKETALPTKQISATWQISPELTMLGQYEFEWVPNRLPEGSTYFAGSDSTLWGPNFLRLEPFRGDKGSRGIGLKWSPEWSDGSTFGFYYRKFDDKGGGWQAQAAPGTYSVAVFAKDISLWGLTFSKNIGGVSVGAELSHRKGTALVSSSSQTPNSAGQTALYPSYGGYAGAIGDTWHGLVNGIWIFGGSSIWSNATLVAELAWSRLDKVTANAPWFRNAGNTLGLGGCAVNNTTNLAGASNNPTIRGCYNGDYLGPTLSFTPTWNQVWDGVTLSAPLLWQTNIGNSPSSGGGSNGFTTYKVGLNAVVYTKHTFDLAYTWWDQKIDRTNNIGAGGAPITGGANIGNALYGRLLGAPYSDKGFLAFTYQYGF